MASLFQNGTDLMVQYARYHRDQRNIVSHFVGIPMIVFSVTVLLSRIDLGAGITAAMLVWAVSTLWYLTRGLGLVGWMTVVMNAALVALPYAIAMESTASWLAWGLGSFFVGWVIQFVGHYWEGRKPAFVDDLVGLLVGPAFIVGEGLFALGLAKDMEKTILEQAGPVRHGQAQHA